MISKESRLFIDWHMLHYNHGKCFLIACKHAWSPCQCFCHLWAVSSRRSYSGRFHFKGWQATSTSFSFPTFPIRFIIIFFLNNGPFILATFLATPYLCDRSDSKYSSPLMVLSSGSHKHGLSGMLDTWTTGKTTIIIRLAIEDIVKDIASFSKPGKVFFCSKSHLRNSATTPSKGTHE